MINSQLLTATEAKKAYLALRRQVNKELAAARNLWCVAHLREMQNVQTIEEAISFFHNAPRGYVKCFAYARWVEICTTLKQLRKAHIAGRRMFPFLVYVGNHYWQFEIPDPALMKWDTIARQELEKVKTSHEAYEIYRRRPPYAHGGLYEEIFGRYCDLAKEENKE